MRSRRSRYGVVVYCVVLLFLAAGCSRTKLASIGLPPSTSQVTDQFATLLASQTTDAEVRVYRVEADGKWRDVQEWYEAEFTDGGWEQEENAVGQPVDEKSVAWTKRRFVFRKDTIILRQVDPPPGASGVYFMLVSHGS